MISLDKSGNFDTVVVWFSFTLLFSLLPLLFDRLRKRTESWIDFWGDGQVLLIAGAISSESLGQSLLSSRDSQSVSVTFLSANFILVFCSALAYSQCSDDSARRDFMIPTHWMSGVFFLFAAIMSILTK